MKSFGTFHFAILLPLASLSLQSCIGPPYTVPSISQHETFLLQPLGLSEPLGMEFVLIPGGVFKMGASDGLENEKPVHKVKVSSFYLSRTEITQAQWTAIMGENPSNNQGCDSCPVERVTYSAVNEFLEKLNEFSGVQVRLPTEAEWEYAAGGGTDHQKYAGFDEEVWLYNFAWYAVNSGKQTHPVGTRRYNRFGLFDMSGNVWEWCRDKYDRDYFSNSTCQDPVGPDNGTYRVIKGGSFRSDADSVRTSRRVPGVTHTADKSIGFRIAIGTDNFYDEPTP